MSETERAAFLKKVDMEIMTSGSFIKKERPLLMITSTSYTPDEDLAFLLRSLELYSDEMDRNKSLPPIHLVVTGSGPQKKMFLEEFKKLN